MGSILCGVIYAAMIKAYEVQGSKLNNYFDDLAERPIDKATGMMDEEQSDSQVNL